MKTLLALLMLISVLLGGCALYTPGGSVVIDPAGAGAQSRGGQFCPPGQAKKGNC